MGRSGNFRVRCSTAGPRERGPPNTGKGEKSGRKRDTTARVAKAKRLGVPLGGPIFSFFKPGPRDSGPPPTPESETTAQRWKPTPRGGAVPMSGGFRKFQRNVDILKVAFNYHWVEYPRFRNGRNYCKILHFRQGHPRCRNASLVHFIRLGIKGPVLTHHL